MSDPLSIAFVIEGPTDFDILKPTVARLLNGRDFIAVQIQPEESKALERIKGGWAKVCQWCLDAAEEAGGRLRDNFLFDVYDLLIIQIDADVAGFTYRKGKLQDPFPGERTLPCEQPCPPPSGSTDRLRSTVLRWIGEESVPQRMVFCTPSKALEAWLLVGLFPNDQVVRRTNTDIECKKNPKANLQCKPEERKLVRNGQPVRKKYQELAPEFTENWARVTGRCSEARRFEEEFRTALAILDNNNREVDTV